LRRAVVTPATIAVPGAGDVANAIPTGRVEMARADLPATNSAASGTNAAGFARRVSPSFTLDPAKLKTPEIPQAPPETSATNPAPQPLAVAPPGDARRPMRLLVSGLILLAVAAWFLSLLLRGLTGRSSSTISRALDRE
jgi:hypothetical protein